MFFNVKLKNVGHLPAGRAFAGRFPPFHGRESSNNRSIPGANGYELKVIKFKELKEDNIFFLTEKTDKQSLLKIFFIF